MATQPKSYKQGGNGSYGTLNSKYLLLQTQIANLSGVIPVTQDIASVLGVGDDALGQDLVNLGNLGVTTINGGAYPPVVATPILSVVMTAGNSVGANDLNMNNKNITNVTNINGVIYPPPASTPNLAQVVAVGNEALGSILLKDNLATPTLTNTISPSSVSITGDGVSGSVGFVVGDVNTIGTATGVISGTANSTTALALSNFSVSTAPFFQPANTTITLNSTTTTASLGFTSGGQFVNAKTMDLTLDGITHTSSSGGNFTINTTDEFNVIADEINATTLTGMSVLSSGAGGTANPSLLLVNSNATLNADPTIELYKTGRNLTTGELVGSISMYGLDATAQKTEFSRIQTKTENVAGGNEDGTLSIFNSVNGVISETFNFNGGQNENNSFRPLDMNGNALRTTSSNLTLDATSSSGTGQISLNPKATSNLYVNGDMLMANNNTISLNDTSPVLVATTIGNGGMNITDTTTSNSVNIDTGGVAVGTSTSTTYYTPAGFYNNDNSIYCNTTNGFVLNYGSGTNKTTLDLGKLEMFNSGATNQDTILLQNTGSGNPILQLFTTDTTPNNSSSFGSATTGGGWTYTDIATSNTKSLSLGSNASAGSSYIIHADNVSNNPLVIQTNQDLQMTIGGGKNLIMTNLPTSNSGLPAGALWNNSGVLNIA